jgi:hypothetical protein
LIDTFFELDKSFTTKEAQEELTKYSEELKPSKEQEIKDINNLLGTGEKLNQDELEQVMAFNLNGNYSFKIFKILFRLMKFSTLEI